MTKLTEWVTGLAVFFGVWYTLLGYKGRNKLVDEWYQMIYLSPLILIAMLGIYAVVVVLYRVFTFNDCIEAAEELQQQIIEAKEDLRKKGFVIEN